jgi:hypothetical protein
MTSFFDRDFRKVAPHAHKQACFAPLLQRAGFGQNAQSLRTRTLLMQLNQRFAQQWRVATASRHFAISNII